MFKLYIVFSSSEWICGLVAEVPGSYPGYGCIITLYHDDLINHPVFEKEESIKVYKRFSVQYLI